METAVRAFIEATPGDLRSRLKHTLTYHGIDPEDYEEAFSFVGAQAFTASRSLGWPRWKHIRLASPVGMHVDTAGGAYELGSSPRACALARMTVVGLEPLPGAELKPISVSLPPGLG